MSDKESTFLRQLRMTLLIIGSPIIIAVGWGLIGMYFGEKDLKAAVIKNTEAQEYVQKYYMTTQDFWNYFDAQKELYDAKFVDDRGRIERLENELSDFRNQFGIKTRGQRETGGD